MRNKIFALLLLLPVLFNFLNADNYMPYPVLFVHGIGSKTGTWDSTRKELKKYYDGRFGYPSGGNPNDILQEGTLYFPMVDYEVRNNGDITEIATEDKDTSIGGKSLKTRISKAISDYKALSGKPEADCKVILVCHSMGGLVARSLLKQDETPGSVAGKSILETDLNYYRNHIDKIIFIGTPHRGSPFASGMYLLTQETATIEQAVNIGGEIATAIYEAQINNQHDKARALQEVSETMYGAMISDQEIMYFFKEIAPVKLDAGSPAIHQLVADGNVTANLTVWGRDPQSTREETWTITTSHLAEDAISQQDKLSIFYSSKTRIITGSAGPDTNISSISWEFFEVRDFVEMMKFEEIDLIISPTGSGLASLYTAPSGGHKAISRSYTFPDTNNSIENFLENGLTDGMVPLASQTGVISDRPVQTVNVFHTSETDEFEPILKFLDEQKPAIVITDSAGGLLPDGCVTNNPDLNIKIIKCTERTGFCGIQKIILYKDTVNSVPYDSNTLNGELEYVYKLKDEIYHSPWEPILPNGRYYIKAIDMAGNESEVRTFTIDTAPPSVAITEPSNNYTYNLNIIKISC